MKMKTGKRLASFFLSACIALSVLFGAVVFAAADTVPTSESVSELSAVYTYADGAEVGTIAANAKAQNIGEEEYVMFYVYQNVDDISDPTNGRQNAQVTSKGFYASDILSGEALAKELPLTPLKLNGKCVLGVQVTNRGDENDWVYAYVTTALKLNPNGGTLTGEDELQARLGFSILDELGDGEYVTREYYKLAGWSETEDGAAIGSDLLMTQYGDEIFALWEQLTTTVTFDPNGGEGDMDPVVINAGEPTELPAPEFDKPGSRFVGWGTSPDGPVVYDGTEPITLTGDEAELPLYAIWADADKFVVTFNANGGDGEMADQEVEAGVATALNANEFILAGSEFIGWATSADGEVVYADKAEVTLTDSDLKLYAVWKQLVATVTFNANGGDGEMADQEVETGVATALNANEFTRGGFKFQGWATSAEGEVVYADKAEVTLDSDLALFAVWKQNNIAVIYSPNGGTGLMTPHKLNVNETINLDKVAYVCEGKTFAGWSTAADGEVEYADEAEFTIGVKSVVLYAIWTDDSGSGSDPEDPPVDPDPKPKAILFSTGGGYGLMNPIKNLSKGQVVELPACEYTKEGYTFGGWSLTSGGAVAYNDCDSVTIGDSTIVLYAVWVA
ncbi:MAG: InlB B-repeat-containing protein [Clostridia bacterium]|nr:InlB B-repeat-containing protein [Clostridia bacterium]